MYETLLPLGSVVSLKGEDKRLMVISRVASPGVGSEVFDYVGCPYPNGITAPNTIDFFNRDDIELVYFIGFQDVEELRFRADVLAPLGELYVNDEGQIVERAPKDAPKEASADGDEIESAVFAEVEG